MTKSTNEAPRQGDTWNSPAYGYRYDLNNQAGKARLFIDVFNSRIRVLDYETKDAKGQAAVMARIARAHHLGKIIWPARIEDMGQLSHIGFIKEAFFPSYYRGEDAWYLSRFLDPERSNSSQIDEEDRLLQTIETRNSAPVQPLPPGFELRSAIEADIPELCELYRNTFSSYPSPITEETYTQQQMGKTAFFKVIFHSGKLVSAASAEVDWRHLNAEITDCATMPEFQGLGLIRRQIKAIEPQLAQRGIRNSFSLARATSIGMNAVLARLDYSYNGRLINNCHMNGRLEDMNLWVKKLP